VLGCGLHLWVRAKKKKSIEEGRRATMDAVDPKGRERAGEEKGEEGAWGGPWCGSCVLFVKLSETKEDAFILREQIRRRLAGPEHS
jgi:hypothetical protein